MVFWKGWIIKKTHGCIESTSVGNVIQYQIGSRKPLSLELVSQIVLCLCDPSVLFLSVWKFNVVLASRERQPRDSRSRGAAAEKRTGSITCDGSWRFLWTKGTWKTCIDCGYLRYLHDIKVAGPNNWVTDVCYCVIGGVLFRAWPLGCAFQEIPRQPSSRYSPRKKDWHHKMPWICALCKPSARVWFMSKLNCHENHKS